MEAWLFIIAVVFFGGIVVRGVFPKTYRKLNDWAGRLGDSPEERRARDAKRTRDSK